MSRGEGWILVVVSGSLDAEVRRHFELNDPKALAAERIGRIESAYVFDLGRVSAPALVYCGGDEDPDEAVPTAKH